MFRHPLGLSFQVVPRRPNREMRATCDTLQRLHGDSDIPSTDVEADQCRVRITPVNRQERKVVLHRAHERNGTLRALRPPAAVGRPRARRRTRAHHGPRTSQPPMPRSFPCRPLEAVITGFVGIPRPAHSTTRVHPAPPSAALESSGPGPRPGPCEGRATFAGPGGRLFEPGPLECPRGLEGRCDVRTPRSASAPTPRFGPVPIFHLFRPLCLPGSTRGRYPRAPLPGRAFRFLGMGVKGPPESLSGPIAGPSP